MSPISSEPSVPITSASEECGEGVTPRYNKAVEPWLNGGREAFDNNNFTIVDSSGVEIFKKIDKVSGTYYPMRDSCHKPGDPKEGCKETGLLYYDEDFIWMKQKNHYILRDTDGSVILDNTIDGTLNYTRSAEKLGCVKHPYRLGLKCHVVSTARSAATRWEATGT